MNYLLEKTIAHAALSFNEASDFMHAIAEDRLSNETISGVLVGIQMRGVELEELNGFRQALLELSLTPKIDASDAIDLCGTGGDGKNTFNISTTSALILAAMGKRVIKHGNYGVSSMCGSSNVLEELGFTFSQNTDELNRDLNSTNICFLHAPLFHPTLKKVGGIRASLGVRTIFNSLGPLVNPVQPKYQLTGTYSLELARIYQHILKDERTDFRVLYGMDCYDEITLTDSTRILGKHVDTIVDHNSFNVKKIEASSLFSGNTVREAANIVRAILGGDGTEAQNHVVGANVATALQLFEPEKEINELFQLTQNFIKSGEASKLLKRSL